MKCGPRELVDEINLLCNEGDYLTALELLEEYRDDDVLLTSLERHGFDEFLWVPMTHGQILYELGDTERARKKLLEAFTSGGFAAFGTVDQKYFSAIWDTVRIRRRILKWIVSIMTVAFLSLVSMPVLIAIGMIDIPIHIPRWLGILGSSCFVAGMIAMFLLSPYYGYKTRGD